MPDLLVSAHVLPGGQEGVGGGEVECRQREACTNIVGRQTQHSRGGILAVQDPAPALTCVDVSEEGGDGWEVSRKIIIYILSLPGEVLGGDDAIGAHLQKGPRGR